VSDPAKGSSQAFRSQDQVEFARVSGPEDGPAGGLAVAARTPGHLDLVFFTEGDPFGRPIREQDEPILSSPQKKDARVDNLMIWPTENRGFWSSSSRIRPVTANVSRVNST
jgi:hypothetical protein